MASHSYDDGNADVTDDPCDDVATWENIPPDDASTQADVEADLLAPIAIDQALERLAPRDRAVIELLYAYRPSPGYAGPWRPDTPDVRQYLSARFYENVPVPRSTLWAWHDAILARWQRQRRLTAVHAAFEALGLSLAVSPAYRRAA